MFDPQYDCAWIGGATSVETPSRNPTEIGAQVTRHGSFLGKKFSCRTQVEEFVPNRVLRMSFIEGPMRGGSVTYMIERDGQGSRVSIHNAGPGPQLGS